MFVGKNENPHVSFYCGQDQLVFDFFGQKWIPAKDATVAGPLVPILVTFAGIGTSYYLAKNRNQITNFAMQQVQVVHRYLINTMTTDDVCKATTINLDKTWSGASDFSRNYKGHQPSSEQAPDTLMAMITPPPPQNPKPPKRDDDCECKYHDAIIYTVGVSLTRYNTQYLKIRKGP